MNVKLLSPSIDLVSFVANAILDDPKEINRNIVVFPGKRPGYFLKKYLAEKLRSSYKAPLIFSMDGFVDYIYEKLGYADQKIGTIDSIAILHKLNEKKNMISACSSSSIITLDEFLPWGFKLFSDLEELCIECVDKKSLEEVKYLVEEKIPPRILDKMLSLSEIYELFYQELSKSGRSTRALRYRRVADEIDRIDFSYYKRVIFAGFFALTKSEKGIFEKMKNLENTLFIFQNGVGIRETLDKLGFAAEEIGEKSSKPEISFFRATDIHGEIFALKDKIQNKELKQSDVIVLPSADSLFPLLHNVLPYVEADFNISLGYPLIRTPIYALIDSLSRIFETYFEGKYFVPDYLKLVLHPYVKNLIFRGASYPTRIIFHTIEEYLLDRNLKFIDLTDLEQDVNILAECLKKFQSPQGAFADITKEEISKHIQEIHNALIRPFETIENIGDFTHKLLEFVSFISQRSPINQHPFSGKFIEAFLEALYSLEESDLKDMHFAELTSYFHFIKNYIRTVTIPFEGTPIKGLQVLGFLEIRNLKFDRVYILDANEGVLPNVRKEDTLLPFAVRKSIGLPTHIDREKIAKYYFDVLINGAKEVSIFYIENGNITKSRFVERLLWDMQKELRQIKLPNHTDVHFRVNFAQREQVEIHKTPEMLVYLRGLTYSSTMLDCYLHCPMQFYYRYVLGLSEKEEIAEDIDRKEVGTIVHDILREFFETKRDKELEILSEDYDKIKEIVEKKFSEEYQSSLSGELYILKHQVHSRMKEILDYHRDNLRGIIIEELEHEICGEFEVSKDLKVAIKGRVDRIDRRGGITYILDYKTGSRANLPDGKFVVEEPRENWAKKLHSLQLPFYIILYRCKNPDKKLSEINSGLLILSQMSISEKALLKDDETKLDRFGQYENAIRTLLREILSEDVPFKPTDDAEKMCTTCPYKTLCGRQWVKKKKY